LNTKERERFLGKRPRNPCFGLQLKNIYFKKTDYSNIEGIEKREKV